MQRRWSASLIKYFCWTKYFKTLYVSLLSEALPHIEFLWDSLVAQRVWIIRKNPVLLFLACFVHQSGSSECLLPYLAHFLAASASSRWENRYSSFASHLVVPWHSWLHSARVLIFLVRSLPDGRWLYEGNSSMLSFCSKNTEVTLVLDLLYVLVGTVLHERCDVRVERMVTSKQAENEKQDWLLCLWISCSLCSSHEDTLCAHEKML